MLSYDVQPITIWPEGWDRTIGASKWSPFHSTWSATCDLLERELGHIRAFDAVIQVDITSGDLRLDGTLRANTKVGYHGVILSFETDQHGALSYPCNAFGGNFKNPAWQENIRAIALGLEALRKVERYGIAERGQQYAGWAQLGAGVAGGSMTENRAWDILIEFSGATKMDDVEYKETTELFREAARLHHPDVGGDPDVFKLIVEARDYLEAYG